MILIRKFYSKRREVSIRKFYSKRREVHRSLMHHQTVTDFSDVAAEVDSDAVVAAVVAAVAAATAADAW